MNRLIKSVGIGLIVIGLSLFVVSLTYNRYTNEDEFQDKLIILYDVEEDRSEQYYKLREEYLTSKFVLENYSITSIILGSILLYASLIGINEIKTPKIKLEIVFLGLLASVITSIGDVGDLLLESYRGSSPPWADSLGIPLMSVPVFFIISIVWVMINLIGIKENFKTNVRIFPMKCKHLNIWYSILAIITILLLLYVIILGFFWLVLPGFLWLYFYISLILGIRESKIKEDEIIFENEIEKLD